MSKNYDELREKAIALRRQGFSLRQIGQKLGIKSGTVSRWVAGVPFNGFNEESLAEQLCNRRDPKVYNRAIELRKQGWSYGMISQELGVSKSTLSGWLRDVQFDEYHPNVKQRVMAGQQAMAEARKQKYAALRAEAEAEASREIEELLTEGLSERDLFLLGLMLYWGEGAKTESTVNLTNSDPAMIQLFILWLEQCLNIKRHQLRGHVHLYPDVDIEEAETYWSDISGIPREQFYKSSVDKRENKLVDKRGKLPYGTFRVVVRGEGISYLHRKLMVWMSKLGTHIEHMRE